MADSSGPPFPPDLPLPTPRVGDRGRFTVADVADTPEGGGPLVNERPIAEFEWKPDRLFRFEDGSERLVNVLLYVDHFQGGDGADYSTEVLVLFDSATGRIVAYQTSGVWEIDGDGEGNVVVNQTQTTYPGDAAAANLPNVLCGLRNALQGQRLNLSAPARFGEDCRWFGESLDGDAGWFVASGTGTVGGYTSTIFDQVPDAGTGATASLRLWVSPSFPYPLRVESDRAASETPAHVIRLAAFEAGTTPLGSSPDVTSGGPSLQLAPPTVTGPAEGAIDHPWPLSEAYDWMLNNIEGYDDIREFVESHENAFMIYAKYHEFHDNDQDTLMWDVIVADGNDWRRRCAAQISIYPQRLVVLTGTAVDQVPYTFYEFSNTCAIDERPHDSFPLPPYRPETMPTVDSLVERWQVHASRSLADLTANFWSFDIYCAAWTCADLQYDVQVGAVNNYELDYYNDVLGQNMSLVGWASLYQHSVLTIDDHGAASQVHESTEWESHGGPMSTGAQEQPTETAEETTAALSPISEAATRDVGRVPIGGVAATAGLAALVAGGLCLVWSSLKGAAVGLFTRLHKDTAAEQPVRAALLDFIDANPGVHLHEIRRRLGLSNGNAVHHLDKLVHLDLITAVMSAGYTCYFPKGKMDYRVMAAGPVLRAETARRLLTAALAAPGSSATQLSAVIGASPKVVSYHLKRLRQTGLVEVRITGREVSIMPTDVGGQAARWAMPSGVADAAAPPNGSLHPIPVT